MLWFLHFFYGYVVCQNLHFNSQLIKFKGWKISSSISQWIYSKYLEINDFLQEKDLKFFYFAFVQLTSLRINRKNNNFPDFFTKTSIKNLKKISLTIENQTNFDCLQNLFKPNLQIEILEIQFLTSFKINSLTRFLSSLISIFKSSGIR